VRANRELSVRAQSLRSRFEGRAVWARLSQLRPLAHASWVGATVRPVSPRPDSFPGPSGFAMASVSEIGGGGDSGGNPSLTEARFEQLIRPSFAGSEQEELPPSSQRRSPRIRRIGLLTSGGDSPGENAAIFSLVKGAIEVYGWEPIGIIDGY